MQTFFCDEDYQAYLALETAAETVARLRLHERTGRALGGEGFVGKLERLLGRSLGPGPPGRPGKRKKK